MAQTFNDGETGAAVRGKINTAITELNSLTADVAQLEYENSLRYHGPLHQAGQRVSGMIARDKQAHILAGAAIAATLALYINPMAGFIAGVVVGALKEGIDRMGFGTSDQWDFIATVLGAAVVLPAMLAR